MAAPAMDSAAICSGVIGRYSDMLGVCSEPVMAQVMMTGFAISALHPNAVVDAAQMRDFNARKRVHHSVPDDLADANGTVIKESIQFHKL